MGIIQDKVLVLTADGYLGLDLLRSEKPYKVYIACMPWGTPVGAYATKEGAEEFCEAAEETSLMMEWRQQNKDWGFTLYDNQKCHVVELNAPQLITMFGQYGEPVKNPQKHILSLLEDASWIGDGLVEWAKENTERKVENDSNSTTSR